MSIQNIGLRTPGVLPAVFGAQGAFLLANAFYTMINPSAASNLPDSPLGGIPDHTVQAMGLTSLALGTFYTIAAYQRNIPIMVASLPGRLIGALVFYRNGGAWGKVAVWEASMGVLTGVALIWELYL
ncbi:uncharacterized protein N7511_003225 [Penicillium nucicola]|uniref:uncharacterized protein n=1 Tax=Penicillium nucicola TaxID=1850975 RepID=UPI0025457EC1|nr:uncharacterized protein N7511_003225 [Penicillium nucicola]KAJ5771174.1 hypothetical protein N7511_003225 [Penicillium nucicola]